MSRGHSSERTADQVRTKRQLAGHEVVQDDALPRPPLPPLHTALPLPVPHWYPRPLRLGAERYAVAVVLSEMVARRTPAYERRPQRPGDDPRRGEPRSGAVRPNLADLLVDFFRIALTRDAAARHHTAAMRAGRQALFGTDVTTEPGETHDSSPATRR